MTGFQEAGVAGRFMIMTVLKDGAAKRVVRGDVDTAFVRKDAGFNLPVGEAGAEGERNVLVHRLEGLEDKGVTHRGGLNAVGEGGVDEVDEEGRSKEGDIGVVGVIRGEEVRSAGEGIGASKKFSRDMNHFEVKIRKVNEPMFLAAVERLGLMEIG